MLGVLGVTLACYTGIIVNAHFIDGCVHMWADSRRFRSCVMAVRDCLLVERRKVASSNLGRSGSAGEFCSQDLI